MLRLFTLQRVPGQAQLVDDVTRDVGLHQLSFLGVILRSLQQVVELLWVELLREESTVAKERTDLFLSEKHRLVCGPRYIYYYILNPTK